MLSAPLQLHTVNATDLFDHLYQFFHRDFVTSRTHLNGTIYIDPQSHRMDDGKEMVFWHLTSRDNVYTVKVGNRYEKRKDRLPDLARAERIEWVKQIIQNHSHPRVTYFYHRETNQNRDIRLYLWAEQDDFVVILQKLGKSRSFLVTSFCIDHQGKRDEFRRKVAIYRAGSLRGCEWF